jgi:hypothetical protein
VEMITVLKLRMLTAGSGIKSLTAPVKAHFAVLFELSKIDRRRRGVEPHQRWMASLEDSPTERAPLSPRRGASGPSTIG